MSIHEDIYSYLSGVAALTALVSDRIYPTYIPQGVAVPCVRFDRTSDGGFKDFDGQGSTVRVEVQFDCLALTLDGAVAVAKAISDDLLNFKGAFGTKYLQAGFLESEFDTFETTIGDGVYRASQAWTIWVN